MIICFEAEIRSDKIEIHKWQKVCESQITDLSRARISHFFCDETL
jgi:hypothetical protein